MRIRMIAALAAFHLGAAGLTAAQNAQPRPEPTSSPASSSPSTPSTDSSTILQKFVGVWTAEPAEVRLVSDLDVSVWGPNASSVRKVEMTINPSLEGVITVTRSVVDARGRTKPHSVSIEEAHLALRAPERLDPNRVEPIVEVTQPERRYPDDNDRWPLDGLVVKLIGTDLEHDRLNLRFDLPDGRGSFGETLIKRPAQGPARRTGSSAASRQTSTRARQTAR